MRHDKSVGRAALRPLLVIVVALAAALAVGVSPAAADGAHSYVRDNHGSDLGSVWFQSKGDHFYVCDHAKDGHSVVAQYYYDLPGGGTSKGVQLWNHTGSKYNGCVNFGRAPDIPEHRTVHYRACTGEYGSGKILLCGPRRSATS